MKRLVGTALLLGVLAWLSSPALAHGLRRGRADCLPPPPSCDCGSNWVEQTITCYRPEYRTRTVPHTVNRLVPREVEQPYKYTEMVRSVTPEKRTETYYTTETKQVPYKVSVPVRVTRPEKRTVTYYNRVTREVPYQYTAYLPVVKPETRTETYYTRVTKQVPYTYTAYVPVVTPEKRTQTYYECMPQEVTRQVPVCHKVPCQFVDPCSGCTFTSWKTVSEMQTVKTVVNQTVPRTREITVNVTNYRPEEHTATRTICDVVPQTRQVTVNVCQVQAQERTATRTICDVVPQTREVTVNVCNVEWQERTGTRTVCETVPRTRELTVNVVHYRPVERTGTRKCLVYETKQETVNVPEQYCTMVPYTKTIRVPVSGCAY